MATAVSLGAAFGFAVASLVTAFTTTKAVTTEEVDVPAYALIRDDVMADDLPRPRRDRAQLTTATSEL